MFESLKLYIHQEIPMDEVLSALNESGYKSQSAITNEGEYARRGGIIDIWPLSFELPLRVEWDSDKITTLRSIDLSTSKSFWDHTVVIILPVSKHHTGLVHFKEDFPLNNFLDIRIGDYVVHSRYGIGKFRGLEKIKIQQQYQDHMAIEYANHEKLFVPIDLLHLVQKYTAFGLRHPKLNRLGTKDWQSTKQKAKKGIQQLAWELLSTEAMRKAKIGFTCSKDTSWEREFEQGFAFDQTPGQAKAWQEVKQDMESVRPMDRLLCGDVGYGKTEVAMRAAYKSVMDGKQVAFLVPTTILAEQHYLNFKKRVQDFPIRVEMLSRLVTKSQQTQIINDLFLGKVDIIIGTHRLLSKEIKFKDLGLIVIDEEQRFGVRSKEFLKRIRFNCDVLALTATPIPRTLYMSLMQIRDFSVIDTPPENRLPIKTFVLEYDDDLIRQAILNEIKRKGQVYYVHNRIFDIDKVKTKLQRRLPVQTKIAIVHGQMPVRQIESTVLKFLNNEMDVLISTAIIESGLDIPNVNTIIVDNADNFGLSDLHQLRGRVGRFKRSAFAYFLLPHNGLLTDDAKKRLDALRRYSDLGSGFKIAMQDLEIRGAGNLLGSQQHGFIAEIGFDLYCRVLRETIEAFREIPQQ